MYTHTYVGTRFRLLYVQFYTPLTSLHKSTHSLLHRVILESEDILASDIYVYTVKRFLSMHYFCWVVVCLEAGQNSSNFLSVVFGCRCDLPTRVRAFWINFYRTLFSDFIQNIIKADTKVNNHSLILIYFCNL